MHWYSAAPLAASQPAPTAPPPTDPPSHGLRRELRFWEAIALSIAIMAPTAAMALNGTAPAGLIGRAVPLAFIFATVGVLLVSYAFIRLSRYFSHAGSVFAFAGVTLGPQAGFFSGWALLGTYFAFTCAQHRRGGDVRRGVLPGHRHLERRRLHGDRRWSPRSSSPSSRSATSASRPARCSAWRASR